MHEHAEQPAEPPPPARLEWAVRWVEQHQTWAVQEYDHAHPAHGEVTIAVYPLRLGPQFAAPVAWAVAVTGVDYDGWSSSREETGAYAFHTRRTWPARRSAGAAYTCAVVQGTRWLGSLDESAARQVAEVLTDTDQRVYDGSCPARVLPVGKALGRVAPD